MRRQALIVLFLAVGVAGATAAPPKKKPPNRPPKVTPIAATFVQQDFATYYHATATDPDGDKLVSTWSLKPPKADPGCSLFNSPDPSDAVWKHGDQNGCNHQIYYNRGHPGIITLKVTDGTFTCTETYFGTLTGKGLFADCKRNKVPKPAGGGKGGKNGGGNNGGGNNGGGNNGGNGGGNGGGGGGGGSGGGGGAQATSKVKLSAKPDTGKPPLAVTFTIKAPKATGWRIDFGDGKSTGAQGTPPKTLAHTYAKEGDFKPILRVQTDPATAYSGATSVLVHLKQLVGLSVSPPSGKSPLKVTFSLETSVTKPAEWDLDFGDGTPPMRGSGDLPATVTHTYAKDGSYKASLAIKPGSLSLLATFATVTVGGGTPPVLSIKAKPTSGKVPLTVTFTTVENVPPRVVSWKIVFGDSTQFASGQGAPPATVTHTFTKKGTFRVYLFVAQQQQYGGVQYQTYVDVTPG